MQETPVNFRGNPFIKDTLEFDLNLNESEADLKLMIYSYSSMIKEEIHAKKMAGRNANQRNSATSLKMVFLFLL